MRIHYKQNFSFKLNLELINQSYTLTFRTVGANKLVAHCYKDNNVWVCQNCAIEGDEITILATDHKLPAGKLTGHIETINSEGKSSCFLVDPNIILSFVPVMVQTDVSETDEAQSLDIIRINTEIEKIHNKLSNLKLDTPQPSIPPESLNKINERLDALVNELDVLNEIDHSKFFTADTLPKPTGKIQLFCKGKCVAEIEANVPLIPTEEPVYYYYYGYTDDGVINMIGSWDF